MFYIKNAVIYTETEVLSHYHLLVDNGKIAGILASEAELEKGVPVIDAQGLNVIPGFIDIHIHGAAGEDVMDATNEALRTIARALPNEGTTAFLATTMTQAPEKITAALESVANFSTVPGEAELIGVHLEGPFLEKTKAGAQPKEFIRPPDVTSFQQWQQLSGDKIKIITIAPEHAVDSEFIHNVQTSGVTISAGHSNASFSQMKTAVAQGVTQVTHLCNGMNSIHHREVGLVGAAFLLPELYGEIIADGVHVGDEMLEIVYKQMGSERLILITDGMRAKGLPNGEYELGGQAVTVKGNRAELVDGTLAGSVLTMQWAVERMLTFPDVSLHDIIQMASVNPAKQAGVFHRKGSIAVGKDADLLIVDDALHIYNVLCRGEAVI